MHETRELSLGVCAQRPGLVWSKRARAGSHIALTRRERILEKIGSDRPSVRLEPASTRYSKIESPTRCECEDVPQEFFLSSWPPLITSLVLLRLLRAAAAAALQEAPRPQQVLLSAESKFRETSLTHAEAAPIRQAPSRPPLHEVGLFPSTGFICGPSL